MRYNEKELQALSRQPAEMAAELGMRGPKKGSDEAEPVGALLLERCRVTREEPGTFSISFIEDPERKYHFECSSEEQCQEWMEALRRASYEFMRRSLIFYRNEIRKVTGKTPGDPRQACPCRRARCEPRKPRNTKVNALVRRLPSSQHHRSARRGPPTQGHHPGPVG
ncbi:pleckstrin homology domain-containing family J member 1 isoform X2 [Cebus imitator]|uniref:pleckstrin homology domain-containing family J member 1 isoform X2 n=1 Tax=Cebus imitator TaxID=2715852 RepID=UPI00080A24FB|nr:pleckstrin homology domain-containing family J member 1 isoform X2 [Cebus imitator]